MKTYNITREKAAIMLSVSTRTIDRYIKSGKLSYKKVANKVLLSKDELDYLQEEFSTLRQEVNTELVGNGGERPLAVRQAIDESIDEKIDKFFLIFKEKDKMLEEKNKVIFMLQQRIGELETKIQNMIALPDYNKEKQEAIMEKQKLEDKISSLKASMRSQEVKNYIVIGFAVIFILVAIYLFWRTGNLS